MTTLENYVERNMLYAAFSRKLPEPSGIGFCAAMAQNRSLNTALANFFSEIRLHITILLLNPFAHCIFVRKSYWMPYFSLELLMYTTCLFGTLTVHMFG